MGIVVREVDEYGSIHDEEHVVPLATLDHNRTNTKHPSSSPPSWTTTKLLLCAGMIGMTAAVASSAVLFYSILDYSNQDSTASSFLLHDRGGTPPPPPPGVYDPTHDFCFHDLDKWNKYCWYPNDSLPDGNWKRVGGHGIGECGAKCTDVTDDDKCIPASGPWPGWISRKHSDVDDDNPYDPRNRPFQTCFSLRGGEDYCWSNSYYDSGDWKPCKPNGFGPQGWAFYLTRNGVGAQDTNIETCGTGCTKFA